MQKPPYPSLYTSQTASKPKPPQTLIPLTTLTEELDLPTRPSEFRPHLTLFGTSAKAILRHLGRADTFSVYEKGRNYVRIVVEDEQSLNKFLALNHEKIGDEIIGVFECAKSVDVCRKVEEKKGILRRCREYFFG